jgi:hypothetical protein
MSSAGRQQSQDGKFSTERFDRFATALLLSLLSITLSGCAQRAAPSLVLFGAFFPAWMLCALFGIVVGIGARIGFVASGLSDILPFQLFLCTSIGLVCALLLWLFWFGP